MRILQVIHQFPPYSSQGSEVYCHGLAQQLSKTDDVRVFHAATEGHRWTGRLKRERHKGLPIYHFVDGAQYSRLADWPNRTLQKNFQSVLEEFAPDAVHFHNYVSLGDDLVSMSRASGAAVVYTLHDFGLICPNTLLLKDDGKLCSKADGDFFQDCCPMLIRTGLQRQRAPLQARAPSLARWRLFARQYPYPAIRTLLLTAVKAAERLLGDPLHTSVSRKRDFFREHTRRIFRDVDLFLAPSEFLLKRYVSCGLPAHKIAHLKNGIRRYPAASPPKPTNQIRFGYIGAMHSHKGIELLLEAFRGFGDRATLRIHGSAFGSPVSKSYWRRIRAGIESNVVFRGSYENEKIGEVLADIDVLVVPSLWYENSPLTIQEAFIFGVPVITADIGGMAELVQDGINGLHFQIGDACDLRSKLEYVVDHPEILDQLRRGIPAIPNLEEHVSELRIRYEELLHVRREEGRLEQPVVSSAAVAT